MSLAAIETLLKEYMGLNAASIGSSYVARAVHQRMMARGVADIHAYTQMLCASTVELKELTEAVVVPETWFFRSEMAFATLRAYVTEEWLPAHPEGKLKVLSIPCSTGEEPYSIVMSLLDAGFEPSRLCVDGIDINSRSLAVAQRGFFTHNSFRSDDLGFRDRYFKPSNNTYRLSERICSAVKFAQDNLLAPGFSARHGTYDIIFCRNLLIYFDRDTQNRAMEILDRMLAPDGMLFVGHAESSLTAGTMSQYTRFPMAFAYTRRPATLPAQAPVQEKSASSKVTRLRTPAPAIPKQVVRAFADVIPDADLPPPAPPPANPLAEAMRLADEGHLVEAARLSEAYLREHGPDAQAFYLLGIVRDAAGSKLQSDEYLRKAIYLDPNHHDALVHLALLAEHRGDQAGARLFIERAERIKARTAGDSQQVRK